MARIGKLLIDEGLITNDQLQEALREQQAGNEFVGTILVQKGWISEEQLQDALIRQTGAPPIDLDAVNFDPELASIVPVALARRARCIPVKKTGTVLHVAMQNPEDERTLEKIGQTSGLTVKPMVSTGASIDRNIVRLYGESAAAAAEAAPAPGPAAEAPRARASKTGAQKRQIDGKQLDDVIRKSVQEAGDVERDDERETEALPLLDIQPLDPPVVRLVNGLLLKAIQMHASDIHVEPMENDVRVRFRVDGVMREIQRLPNSMKSAIGSRVKIMANLNIAERRVPQDGGIKMALSETEAIDFRTSILPQIYGEKIVMRVLGVGELKNSVPELGFKGRALELVQDALNNPVGMILVTGPTGSGKTTTLYTILRVINTPDVNIVTAEDPVEYRLDGITQVNVRPIIGYTFDAALRSFLRQDPDIILVGEMRDFETAGIAVKAALTGHLVLSTLHTNDAPSCVVRLIDMGIEPYLVASAVKVVIAQRLLRRICTNCREELPLKDAERTDLDQAILASIEKHFRGKGCTTCGGTGYKGRIPVFEVMGVKSQEMRRIVTEGGTEVQVAAVARREGLRTLSDEALDLVNQGVTSLDEAIQIIVAD